MPIKLNHPTENPFEGAPLHPPVPIPLATNPVPQPTAILNKINEIIAYLQQHHDTFVQTKIVS